MEVMAALSLCLSMTSYYCLNRQPQFLQNLISQFFAKSALTVATLNRTDTE
jgi:hypothetical protein